MCMPSYWWPWGVMECWTLIPMEEAIKRRRFFEWVCELWFESGGGIE